MVFYLLKILAENISASPPLPGEVARLLMDYFVVAQLEPLISHPVPLPGQPTAQTWNAPKVGLSKPWKYTFVLRFFKFILTALKSYFKSKEEEEDRREGKGRRWCLGDILECRSSHLASTMIWRKVFEEHPLWEGDGLVWCEPDDHPFFWSIHILPSISYSIHPFLQIVQVLKLLCGTEFE